MKPSEPLSPEAIFRRTIVIFFALCLIGLFIGGAGMIWDENATQVCVGVAAAVLAIGIVVVVVHRLIRMLSDNEPRDGEIFPGEGP